jgi:hypothetical protein
VQTEIAGRSTLTLGENRAREVDLSEGLRTLKDGDGWPVRHQHARGTCNAFAVVASEELRRFHLNGQTNYVPLSEEHLYDKAWRKPLTGINNPPTGQALKILQEQGGTFLVQLKNALINDGLADAKDAPYKPNASIIPPKAPTEFDDTVECKARKRTVAKDKLFHDITDAGVGANRDWQNGSSRSNLVNFFVDQLSKKKPIAAGFAILNEAEYVWTGALARTSGHIRYPTDKIVEGKRPVAGHSVCLVGYRANEDDKNGEDPYTFLFRNSYGTDIFAKDAHKFLDRLNGGLPGYGIISSRDVKRYCWEFLTHAPAEDIAKLTGSVVTSLA